MTIRRNKLALAMGAALVLSGWQTSALADGSEVDALKARIEQLEQMVNSLMDERRSRQAAGSQRHDQTVQRIEKLETAVAEKEADSKKSSRHSFKFGGYVKTDAIYSNYSDGDLASGSAGRDFYIPGTIPVGGGDESTDLDMHAKESRINFRSEHLLDSGDKITSFVEMDFLLSPGGDERVSNSYNPRLRHAFVTYNNWLFGQTWSTFQNVGALAENVDFVGPAEGTVFERQAMIRYSNGPWQFAIENPETTVTPNGGGGRIISDDNGIPDIVARYTHSGDWGNFVVAGIARNLSYDTPAQDESTSGYGLSLSGKFMFGKNDLRWMLSGGSGMGRYMGLNTANGAVIEANGSLEAIDSMGGFISYRHLWSDKWRSNFTYSRLDVDNDTALTGMGVTKQAQSAHVNLIYSPLPKLDVGFEYMWAEREIESGADGTLNRIQVMSRYSF